jgi:hypothetical protein
MIRPWYAVFFRLALAACMQAVLCAGFFAALPSAHADEIAATPKKRQAAPLRNAGKPKWGFQTPDKGAQNARRLEPVSATLFETTFAPSTPDANTMQSSGDLAGMLLPPTQADDPDMPRPPENKPLTLGGGAFVYGKFINERSSWRPHNDSDVAGIAPALKVERRAGAYAGFQLDEAVELKIGSEYYLGSSASRPEHTGHKDNSGVLGMDLKLKIDF